MSKRRANPTVPGAMRLPRANYRMVGELLEETYKKIGMVKARHTVPGELLHQTVEAAEYNLLMAIQHCNLTCDSILLHEGLNPHEQKDRSATH